jgi:hypothetical protein
VGRVDPTSHRAGPLGGGAHCAQDGAAGSCVPVLVRTAGGSLVASRYRTSGALTHQKPPMATTYVLRLKGSVRRARNRRTTPTTLGVVQFKLRKPQQQGRLRGPDCPARRRRPSRLHGALLRLVTARPSAHRACGRCCFVFSGLPTACGMWRSGGLGETLDDVLVEAEVLFGGLDRQAAVQAFPDSQIELARVAAL